MPHTSVVYTHPTIPSATPDSRTRILLKQYWDTASWTELEECRFDYAVWAISPSMPRAQFSKRFGERIAPGGITFETIARQDPSTINGQYVKILNEYYDSATASWVNHWCWYGRIEITGSTTDGPVDESTPKDLGDQTFLCFGLERWLEQHRISKSFWRTEAGDARTSDVGFVFNKDGKGNRTSGKFGGYYNFGYHPDPDGITWSTRDIVEYLIKSGHGVPKDDAGNQDVTFQIEDQDRDLLPDWDAPEVETHGVSTKQILDALVSRRRLYSWWLEYDETADIVYFRVGTFTDSDITLNELNGVIPANPNTVDIDVRFDATAMQVEQEDISHTVDQVIAYGAKRTTTTTVDFGVSTGDHIKRAWTSAQEADYEDCDSSNVNYPPSFEIRDRREWHRQHRTKETLQDVFRRWVLDDSLAYPPDDPDNYEAFFENIKILPKLALQMGVDYSGNTIDSQNFVWLDVDHVQRDPFLLIQIPRSSPAKYVDMSQLGSAASLEVDSEWDIRDWRATVRVPRDGKSITISVSGAPQYTLAWSDFNARAEDQRGEHGEWDWQTIKATLSFEDERYAEGRYPSDANLAGTNISAVRTMRVHAGSEYRKDYVANGTVVGVDAEGSLVTATNDGYLKDDTAKLTDIAEMAYRWYSKTRRAVRIRRSMFPVIAGGGNPLELSTGEEIDLSTGEVVDLSTGGVDIQTVRIGQYLTALSRQTSQDYTVGSIISQISVEAIHDYGDEPRRELPPMKTTINTAFGELDYVRLKQES